MKRVVSVFDADNSGEVDFKVVLNEFVKFLKLSERDSLTREILLQFY